MAQCSPPTWGLPGSGSPPASVCLGPCVQREARYLCRPPSAREGPEGCHLRASTTRSVCRAPHAGSRGHGHPSSWPAPQSLRVLLRAQLTDQPGAAIPSQPGADFLLHCSLLPPTSSLLPSSPPPSFLLSSSFLPSSSLLPPLFLFSLSSFLLSPSFLFPPPSLPPSFPSCSRKDVVQPTVWDKEKQVHTLELVYLQTELVGRGALPEFGGVLGLGGPF